jgi:hypothetical protein
LWTYIRLANIEMHSSTEDSDGGVDSGFAQQSWMQNSRRERTPRRNWLLVV